MIDSALVDGSYGQEKVNSKDRLADILFNEVNDSNILEKFAQKLLSIRTQEQDEHFGDLSYSTNERETQQGFKGVCQLRPSQASDLGIRPASQVADGANVPSSCFAGLATPKRCVSAPLGKNQ